MRPLNHALKLSTCCFSIVVVSLVIGCAKQPDLEGIGGAFNVIGPDRHLAVTLGAGDIPQHWHTLGEPPENILRVTEAQRVPALEIIPTSQDYWYVRDLHASLLATPYLGWAWLAISPRTGPHPIRLVIGFADTKSPRTAPWWKIMSADFPLAERIVTIEWADTALGRGTVIGPKVGPDDKSYARYIARGGPEYSNRWWNDSVDLSLLHRQLWPNSSVQHTEVRFIGVWSVATNQPVSMYLANVRLFR